MMDSTTPTSNSNQEPAEQKDDLQCKILKNQNNQEIGKARDFYNTPVSEIEAPLSPVLTNSKKSLRYIARRKSRKKLMSKFSQNSSTSQDYISLETQSQVEEEEQISSTDNLKLSVETSAVIAQQNASEEINECSELEARMKRCIEMQRNKKFCYNIAASSSKLSENLESYDTSVNCNLKIIDSSLSKDKSYGSSKTIESFISDVNIPDCKVENDFNFKIPESPVSVSKLKRAKTEIMPTHLETNIKAGFETGSGKKIKLSEKALKRASKLFDDIIDIPCDSLNISSTNSKNVEDKNTETNFNNNENISNLSFKTASGNTLKLTESSITKIKTLFDDVYDLSNYKQIDVETDLKTCTNTEEIVSGTSTQNETKKDNKLFSIETKLKTKKLNETQFKTPIQPVDNKPSNFSKEEISPDSKNLPFTQITDTQMCWAAENAECMAEFMNSQWTTSPKHKSLQCQKTQQSNEKNIKKTQEEDDAFLSPESEQLFGNLTVCEDGTVATRNYNQLNQIESSVDKNSDMPSFEFATKSEEEIIISEESLTSAGNMFQDCDIVENINDKNNISVNIRTVGFATASGKRVALSEESLNNAKNMFQDCYNESNSDILESIATVDFSKVSGKDIPISEDSLGTTKTCKITDANFEDNTDKNINIQQSIEKKITLSDETWGKDMYLNSMNEENLNIEFPTSALFEEIPENIAPIPEEVQDKAKTKTIEAKDETNKAISQQSTEREQKYEEPVQSGFLTSSGSKIVISQDLLNKARNICEDNLDVFRANPEEDMHFDFVTPCTSIIVPEDSLDKAKNNLEASKEILRELLTDNKNMNSLPNIDDEKDSNCSDCCGFTWDESLKSLKIYELYKRSFKYIEKDIKTNVIYPLSFTFDHIQSSKEYKNKNYKYAFRSRKKSSVVYGSNKRKSTRGERKSVNNSPTTSELLNTSTIITRSKRHFITEEDITSINSSSKTRSRTRRSKDNASNDSSISSISNETDKTSSGSKSSNKSNSQKTKENLEDAFLSCIENTLKDINSQETSSNTNSFFSTDDINSLKEEFSEESNFDLLPENERIEQNSSIFYTPLINDAVVRSCDILEKTNIIINPPENNMNYNFSTEPGNNLEVERMKIIFNECDQELENKIMINASESNISYNEDHIAAESLKKINVYDDTGKENIDNYNTPKTDLKFGFSTASGKKIIVNEENLKKARNIFEDDLNINLNTSQTERNFNSKQNYDTLEKDIESPINALKLNFDTVSNKEDKVLEKSENIFQDFDAVHSNCDITQENLDSNIDVPKSALPAGFATASGKKVAVSEDSLKRVKNIFQDCDIAEENLDQNIDTPKTATPGGFATTSGKKVAISKDSLKRVKNIFQDCDITEENLDQNIDTPKTATSGGFATASGKKVTISEDSLKRVKNIFQDCDIAEENLDQNIDTLKTATPGGCATASGKKVTISEDSLKRMKNIFQDCDITEENLDQNIDTPKTSTPGGFATASGKIVTISADSLKRVKNIFQDCDIAEENLDQNIDTPKTATSGGFATASGTKVTISEDSLKREKNIFQDCDITEENLDQNIDTPKTATSGGFATASGKKVTISEDSLKRVKNIFQDCDIAEKNLDQNIDTPKTATSGGFATASGTKVTISEDSLKRVKNIFQDCDIAEKNLDQNIDIPKTATSGGFATASGKKVTISEDSLKRVKNIFQDCDITEENLDQNIDIPKTATSGGFATASGKKVTISEDSLKRVKNIFQDCDIAEENLDQNIDIPKTATSDGFATASGKKVTISEDSLKRVKNIFQDCDITEENLDQNIDIPKTATSGGFATASGKKVTISEDSLKRVKNIFQDCDITEENLDQNIDIPKTATSGGCATASGKKVTISEDSLKRVKNIFQDCDIAEENLDQNIDIPKTATSGGFATASGKKVTISEDSLKRVKNIFQDCDIAEENLDQNIDTPKTATSGGFATASGKKVTISEDSLKRVKNIFQDCDIAEKNLDQNIDIPKTATSGGFATASGKKVTISEDSLKRMKNIFQDCDITEENLDQNIDIPKTATSGGFATASGKKVTISEDSLKRVKNIFQDCDITEENLDQNIDFPKTATSGGFATASGKKVTISEDSLKRVKNIFQDCDIAEENLDQNIDTPKTATSGGFATASGKKVTISEDSLKRVKNIFQDCDITDENLDQNIDTSKTVAKIGFATASGNKVDISEEALEKAKLMFDDANETEYEQKFVDDKHVFDESFTTPITSVKCGFSTALGSKVFVSEDALNKARNIFEDNADSTELIHKVETKLDPIISTNVAEKSFKRTRSISDSCEENRSILNTPKNDSISEQKIDSIQISKSKIIQRTNSSPVVAAKKSNSSPQISTNDSTPILRNRTLSARNSKKRSLGVTSCRQIDIPENSMKRAKLVFDDIDSPKKIETTINNNHLQNYSPLANRTNIPQNVSSKSTPNIPIQNTSLLNSTITIKESNQQKIAQSVAIPKISPLKRLYLGNENLLENSSFVFQKETSGDLKKWKIDLQKELETLKLKMSVIETRMQLLNKQQEIIEVRSSDHRRQRLGCLFTKKLNCDNRISLKEAVKNRRPEKNTYQICLNIGVDPSLLDITADNSSTLHFHVPWWPNDNRTYPAVIRTEDGACVVPNQQNFVGVIEIETAFLAMQGIDPNLVPKKWVTNHYRWIVWKLASLERNYPGSFKNCLTVESVISQLKYRYDREVDRAQRPALRKIVECDDSAAKRMVLCVATIIKLEDNRHELELTDGWYSIKTILDAPLNSLVETNVIKVGMKLMTQGAELQNCEGCYPLELPSNVRLKIHYNSTRRAAWHTKLGYQPNPGPLRISLRMIAGNGGPVGGVQAYIARIYPICFMERCDESIIWRNKRAEIRRANQWETSYSNTMENMQLIVQQELEQEWMKKENKSKIKRLKIKDVTGVVCGETLYQFMEDSNDPECVKELLSSEQISALQEYQNQLNVERQGELTSRLREKLSSEKIKPRNVSTVLKLLLVDMQSLYHHRMLSVWRPTEIHTQLLKEGLVINIYNVIAKYNGTLSSISRTQFDVDSDFDTSKFENTNRFIIPISQTANSELKPQFGEFDTIGMVVKIDIKQTAQTLWIADEKYRFLLVKIRNGPDTCCLFDGITPGKIIAVMNLIHQKPFKCYGEAVANQYTVLSCYPQQEYLQDFMKEFIENLSESENVEQYLEECKNRVEIFSAQRFKQSFILNPLNICNSEEETATLYNKLCGIGTQQNKADSLTLSDEEMALIDSQAL